MFELIAFYFFAVLTIVMFFIVVTTNNILYALTALASGMIFISSFFFLLDAEFLGVVQIAVYTGAVIVMYAFGLMFVDAMEKVREKHKGDMRLSLMVFGAAIVLVVLFCAPLYESIHLSTPTDMTITQHTGAIESNTAKVGQVLFGRYVIAFEIAGVLLLVALIAGIALGIRTKITRESHALEVNEQDSTNTQSHTSTQRLSV